MTLHISTLHIFRAGKWPVKPPPLQLEVKWLAQGHLASSCCWSGEWDPFTFPFWHLPRQHGDSNCWLPTHTHTLLFITSRQQPQPSAPFFDKTSPTDRDACLDKSKLLQWPPKCLAGGGSDRALESARSLPPVAVSPLSAAIHHGPAIWVHLQPTGPRQEGLSVCQSLSNDTRPGWPPILTNKAHAACSRVE